jgi:hypothetical protein
VAAINSIYDRIEGRPKQSIAIEDQTDREQLSGMTDEQLIAALRERAAEAKKGSMMPGESL